MNKPGQCRVGSDGSPDPAMYYIYGFDLHDYVKISQLVLIGMPLSLRYYVASKCSKGQNSVNCRQLLCLACCLEATGEQGLSVLVLLPDQ